VLPPHHRPDRRRPPGAHLHHGRVWRRGRHAPERGRVGAVLDIAALDTSDGAADAWNTTFAELANVDNSALREVGHDFTAAPLTSVEQATPYRTRAIRLCKDAGWEPAPDQRGRLTGRDATTSPRAARQGTVRGCARRFSPGRVVPCSTLAPSDVFRVPLRLARGRRLVRRTGLRAIGTRWHRRTSAHRSGRPRSSRPLSHRRSVRRLAARTRRSRRR